MKTHKVTSTWNETQLQLIVETMVNFIDTYTETFIAHGYPGTPVWAFEQMRAINNHVKTLGYLYDSEDARLQELRKPLSDFRSWVGKSKLQPTWVWPLDDTLSMPMQLTMGWYYKLGLDKLQDRWYDETQTMECHTIIDAILTEAIDRIKHSSAYQTAAAAGTLYYDVTAYARQQQEVKEASPPRATSILSQPSYTRSAATLFRPSVRADHLSPTTLQSASSAHASASPVQEETKERTPPKKKRNHRSKPGRTQHARQQ